MLFIEKFRKILQKTPGIPNEQKLLSDAHKFAFIILVLLGALIALQHGSFSLRYLNHSIAWTSVLLIGLSFALSGICYFWDFADTKILYRKHLGIAGFHYVSIHYFLSLYLLSRRANILEYFSSSDHFWPFFFGTLGLIYFSFMTAISNQHAAHELGGLKWRKLLRLGYIAFVFGLVHILFLRWEDYREWWESGTFIPTVGITLLTFSIVVLLLRVVLSLRIHLKKTSPVPKAPTKQPEV